VDPDILIIDEALSVGDVRFQQKSFSRIKEFCEEGKTILFVSHDMNTITSFCDEAIILEDGIVKERGEPKGIAESYHKMMFGSNAAVSCTKRHGENSFSSGEESIKGGYGDRACEVLFAGFFDSCGNAATTFNTGDQLTFRMRVRFNKAMNMPSGGLVLRNAKGMDVFGVTSDSIGCSIGAQDAGKQLEIVISMTMRLAGGDYFATFGMAHEDGTAAHFFDNAIHIKVIGNQGLFTSSIVDLEPTFLIEELH